MINKQDMRLVLAAHRFGLGARKSTFGLVPADISKALLDEVRASQGLRFDNLESGAQSLSQLFRYRASRNLQRKQGQENSTNSIKNPTRQIILAELNNRFEVDRTSRFGFGERIVRFWSNHFSVSAINPRVGVLSGAYEREAIRPHITGSFEDILLSAISHPAMLIYLDNARSIGPNSKFGQRRSKGLNENLAREILELHTLGVDGGYSQSDVTNFAKVLTGWSVFGRKAKTEKMGRFVFRKAIHEPGPQTIMGRNFPDGNFEQGRNILKFLARHPSTAKFVSEKLVQHFVADTPSQALVSKVESTFLETNGDLQAIYKTLLSAPESWSPTLDKVRRPYEFVIAASRAFELPLKSKFLYRMLKIMGQQPFRAPSPQGWPDKASDWISPDAVKTRLDWAELVSRKITANNIIEHADHILGPLLSGRTRETLARAESTNQAIALMLLSPEFQRR